MEIKQCQFCGNKNIVKDGCKCLEACKHFEDCEEESYVAVVCNVNEGGCGASSGYYLTLSEAVSKWNRRADNARL